MPSVAQQQQIDSANAQLANAKSAMDSAYASAKTAHDSLFKCVAGKGTTNNCSNGQPLGSDAFPSFGNSASAGSCKICNSLKDCKSDCCNEETCTQRVSIYNSSITTYNVAKANYDSAKTNLQTVLDSISQQVASDPDVIAETNQIKADAEVAKNKWTFFGLCTLVVLGIGAFMWFKTEVKKAFILGGVVGVILLLYVVFFGIGGKE